MAKKKKTKPLTVRCHAALKRGAATSDKIAKRVRVDAVAVVKALSALKQRGLAHFTSNRIGENVWRRGKGRSTRR